MTFEAGIMHIATSTKTHRKLCWQWFAAVDDWCDMCMSFHTQSFAWSKFQVSICTSWCESGFSATAVFYLKYQFHVIDNSNTELQMDNSKHCWFLKHFFTCIVCRTLQYLLKIHINQSITLHSAVLLYCIIENDSLQQVPRSWQIFMYYYSIVTPITIYIRSISKLSYTMTNQPINQLCSYHHQPTNCYAAQWKKILSAIDWSIGWQGLRLSNWLFDWSFDWLTS